MTTTLVPYALHQYSYEEYLAYERASELKHEYIGGEIVAMAGGSRRHNALAAKITATLVNTCPPGCVVFQSDQRIRILASGVATYPDVSMVCGPTEVDPADPGGETITNPTLLVEVLSASTEQIDRGFKWQQYQRIPSLQEYVLVSQASPRVEIYRRLAVDRWEYVDVQEGTVQLASGATLDLAMLYADLPV
jgi:Uma2 family endonuclease